MGGASDRAPRMEVAGNAPVVLERLVGGGARTLFEYQQAGGHVALERALQLGQVGVVEEIERSGLRGRGGAGFPTGRKWRSVGDASAGSAFVVCNADEGDPGAYIDRFILEDDPHVILEAMAIAAVAVAATRGIVYVRAEYPRARESLERAIVEERAAGILGDQLLGGGPSFDIELVVGEGSYLCGEETALLNAIEGRRPEVRSRPPFPATCGLFGAPTAVNNVETLATVPWIIRHGADAYASLGTEDSRGTKLVSLNSLFDRPGLYEVEFGVPLRMIVEELGGGLSHGHLAGVLVGGPLAGIVPPQLLDTPFTFRDLRGIGAEVGHGGVVAFDERTSIAELLHHVLRFAAYESCGKCTPCRLGSSRLEQLLASVIAGIGLTEGHRQELVEIVDALAMTSLCGHGTGLAELTHSALRWYPDEVDAWFA
ncbi:MAG TPA: NADH-ubiquinone oxidoreductase-F iron-sulfur binding region domain-containing protein [Microthrixaceae bacterium]|nr:NADH-ubiquinone oxidoreductase-F iron-sulfur binding region domain-containing protein [Microthrixaceae bacterium]